MNIGMAIRAARVKAGMTQDEVADKSGMLRTHLSKIENGMHDPSLETLSRIGEAIGIEGWKIYRFAEKQNVRSLTRVILCTDIHGHIVP